MTTWTARTSGHSFSPLSGIAVTAGDLIIALVGSTSNSSPTATDNASGGSNTYTLGATYTSNRPSYLSIVAAIAKATETLTITGSSGVESVHCVVCYPNSGTPSLTPDVTGSDANSDSISISTTTTDTLIVATCDSSTGCTEGSGFTLIGQDVSSMRMTSEYHLTLGASSGSHTVNFAADTQRGIVAAAYKIASAGGGTFNPYFYRQHIAGGMHGESA